MNNIYLILFTVISFYFIIKRFIIPAILKIKDLNKLKKNGKKVKAIVTDFRIDKDPDGLVSYLRIVEYEIKNHPFKSVIDYPLKTKPIIGENIMVYYHEDDPNNVVINIDKAIEKNYMAVFFISIMLLLVLSFLIFSLL